MENAIIIKESSETDEYVHDATEVTNRTCHSEDITEKRGAYKQSPHKISKALQAKDKLIQQFSHTLRSLLGPAREFVRTAIKTGNTDRLKNVLSDLESVDKNLELLSLSARDPRKLKKRITESLAESGYGLSEILFSSAVSSLSLVLNSHEYEGHVLSRYLVNIGGRKGTHIDGFSKLRDGDREALLGKWKESQDWDDETEKQNIFSKKWETLTKSEIGEIYHSWLRIRLNQELEEMRHMRNLNELGQWLCHNFFCAEFDIRSEIYFRSEGSEGAVFFSWLFSEICLNCLKYAKSGGAFRVSFDDDAENHCMRFENEIPERTVFAPRSSGSGLDVLTIIVENLSGTFRYSRRKPDNMFEVVIRIPKLRGGYQ